MIFAEMMYEKNYDDIHNELLLFITARFSHVEAGHQGDSYIWIFDGGEKVAIDTFTSMKHQIKSSKPGPHVQKVINALRQKYRLTVYETPEFEGFEDRPVA
nr:hypothetical protein [uncultured Pseudomonas sp.]